MSVTQRRGNDYGKYACHDEEDIQHHDYNRCDLNVSVL